MWSKVGMTKLIIEGRLESFNTTINSSRGNKHKANKSKQAQQGLVMTLIKHQKLKPLQKFPVKVYFTWFEKDARRDPDNIASGGTKIIMDALVKTKILPDDSVKYVNGLYNDFEVDNKNPRIEVEIKEV